MVISTLHVSLVVRGRGVPILVIGSVERHSSHDTLVLESNPRLQLEVLQHRLRERDLTRTTNPVTVSSISSVLSKAEVHALALDGHPIQQSVPLVAPRVAVLVGVEESHHSGRVGNGLHERDVLAAVIAGGVVATIGAEAVALLGHGHRIVDSRLEMLIHSDRHAEGLGGENRDVDERQRRNHLLELLGEPGALLLEPRSSRRINPAGLLDERPVGLVLLVVEAAAAVEEPEEQLRHAVTAAAISIIHREEVVGDTGLSPEDHAASAGVGVFLLLGQDHRRRRVDRVVVIAVGRAPGQTTLNERLQKPVNVVGTVLPEGAGTVKQVTVDDDEVGRLRVEDGVHDLDGVLVLDVVLAASISERSEALLGLSYHCQSEDPPRC